jgi:hypothetical protein
VRIFHGGSSWPLDIRASFYNGEGQSLWPFLVFQCLSLGVPPLCLGTSKKGGAEGPTLPIYIAFCYRPGAGRSLHLISPCDLVPFKMYVHIFVALSNWSHFCVGEWPVLRAICALLGIKKSKMAERLALSPD